MKAQIRENSVVVKENVQHFTRRQKRYYCKKTGMSKEKFSELFEQDVYEAVNLENCVNKRISVGGTCVKSVEAQIEFVKGKIK